MRKLKFFAIAIIFLTVGLSASAQTPTPIATPEASATPTAPKKHPLVIHNNPNGILVTNEGPRYQRPPAAIKQSEKPEQKQDICYDDFKFENGKYVITPNIECLERNPLPQMNILEISPSQPEALSLTKEVPQNNASEDITFRLKNEWNGKSISPILVDPSKKRSSNWTRELSFETGINSSYDGMDVGDRFYDGWVVNQNISAQFTYKERFNVGGFVWLQMPITNFEPSYGWEADFGLNADAKLGKGFGIEGSFANYQVKGGWINNFTFGVSKEIPLQYDYNLEVRNETTVFTTSKSLGFRGGVVNKTSYTFSKKFVNEVITPSLILAHSVDNDPFWDKAAFNMRGFITGEINIAVGERSSIFFGGSYYFGIVKDTVRQNRGFLSFGYRFSKLF